jgi:hypothetical protein
MQYRMLGSDSSVRPRPGILNESLERASRLATHDFLVALISNASGANTDTSQLVTTIARHNDVVMLFVYDRELEQI